MRSCRYAGAGVVDCSPMPLPWMLLCADPARQVNGDVLFNSCPPCGREDFNRMSLGDEVLAWENSWFFQFHIIFLKIPMWVDWDLTKAEAFREVISACEQCGESEEARDLRPPIEPCHGTMAPWHHGTMASSWQALRLFRLRQSYSAAPENETYAAAIRACDLERFSGAICAVWKACVTIMTPKKNPSI